MPSYAPTGPYSATRNNAAASSTCGRGCIATLTLVSIDGPVGEGLAANALDQPEVVALHAETRDRLAHAIVELPPRYAAAVVLRHVQGLSYAEAAEVLEQPIGTTKSDVHRGVRLLRDALEPELLAEARTC
jgi:RNA polymerase sigma factor (sigma-70 family)